MSGATFAEKVRTYRDARSWTAARLAFEFGVSARTVEGWEQGRKPSRTAEKVFAMILARDALERHERDNP